MFEFFVYFTNSLLCPPFNSPTIDTSNPKVLPDFDFLQKEDTSYNTHIFVTNIDGVESGRCTNPDSMCSINYVFFSDEFEMPENATIHFDDSVDDYPQALINITKPLKIVFDGGVLENSLQFYINPGIKGEYIFEDGTFINYTYSPFIIDQKTPIKSSISFKNLNFNDLEEKAIFGTFLDAENETSVDFVNCIFNYTKLQVSVESQIGASVYLENNGNNFIISKFINDTFLNNTIFAYNDSFIAGTALGLQNIDFLLVTNSSFEGNSLNNVNGIGFGSSIYLDCDLGHRSQIYITNTTFKENIISSSINNFSAASGICSFNSSSFNIINTTFDSNKFTNSGQVAGIDVFVTDSINVEIYNSSFINTSSDNVGMIAGKSVFNWPSEESILKIMNSVFDSLYSEDWTIGGSLHSVYLNNSIYNALIENTKFLNSYANYGSSMTFIIDNACSINNPCNCDDDNTNLNLTLHNLIFSNCSSVFDGTALYISPSYSNEESLCSPASKYGNVTIDNVYILDNKSPGSSIYTNIMNVDIFDLNAYNNDLKKGIFGLINTNTNVNKEVNIVKPTDISNITYGILVSGGYSSLRFNEDASVYMNSGRNGESPGLFLDDSAEFATFQIYGDMPIIDSVYCGENPMCEFRTSSKENPSNECLMNNLETCPPNSSYQCMNFCSCNNSRDYYCEGCNARFSVKSIRKSLLDIFKF